MISLNIVVGLFPPFLRIIHSTLDAQPLALAELGEELRGSKWANSMGVT